MTPAEHEAAQLALIKAEYESNGFVVTPNASLPFGQTVFVADAMARHKTTHETVLIEVVNKLGKLKALAQRVAMLTSLLGDDAEKIRLDIRYIENPFLALERAGIGASKRQPRLASSLQALRDASELPIPPSRDVASYSARYLQLWSEFAQTMRAFNAEADAPSRPVADPISLEFLWREIIKQQQVADDSALAQFTRLQDLARIALEGGRLSRQDLVLMQSAAGALIEALAAEPFSKKLGLKP